MKKDANPKKLKEKTEESLRERVKQSPLAELLGEAYLRLFLGDPPPARIPVMEKEDS